MVSKPLFKAQQNNILSLLGGLLVVFCLFVVCEGFPLGSELLGNLCDGLVLLLELGESFSIKTDVAIGVTLPVVGRVTFSPVDCSVDIEACVFVDRICVQSDDEFVNETPPRFSEFLVCSQGSFCVIKDILKKITQSAAVPIQKSCSLDKSRSNAHGFCSSFVLVVALGL